MNCSMDYDSLKDAGFIYKTYAQELGPYVRVRDADGRDELFKIRENELSTSDGYAKKQEAQSSLSSTENFFILLYLSKTDCISISTSAVALLSF